MSEVFFAILKKEALYRRDYRFERDFKQSVDKFIRDYNTERPIGSTIISRLLRLKLILESTFEHVQIILSNSVFSSDPFPVLASPPILDLDIVQLDSMPGRLVPQGFRAKNEGAEPKQHK